MVRVHQGSPYKKKLFIFSNLMTKTITKIIYFLVFIFLKFLDFIFKKNFSYLFKDLEIENSYESIRIHKKKVFFFIPNTFTKYRLVNFFKKEPDTLNWIDNFKKKSIFFDIGANTGNYTIYAAVTHSSIKDIFAFEPSFLNTRVLSRNISINKLNKKIKIIQLPLSNKKNKVLEMSESTFEEGGSFNTFGTKYNSKSIIHNKKNNYSILGTNLDYLINLKILPIPNYIKIDVDGIEHLILQGAKKTIKNKRVESILIELYPNFKTQYNFCFKILKRNGFKLQSKYGYNHIF